ncbi:MAG: hypothetical protein IKW67_01960 [Alphaproteobacteria bacterium]|nr:hypothetical protein [Alphaproteobacteria bacterium]
MHFKHLTAYMLGNKNHEYLRGEQWWPYDTRVWMCPNIAIAERELRKSQNKMGGAIWTDIYRISADEIVCEQSNHGLYYTETPTKIFVESKVSSIQNQIMTEQDLLDNAATFSEEFMKKLDAWKRRRR